MSQSEPPSPASPIRPDLVRSDPVLKSIFDRIRTGQRFKTSEFAHFIAPLVQEFEAAAGYLFGWAM